MLGYNNIKNTSAYSIGGRERHIRQRQILEDLLLSCQLQNKLKFGNFEHLITEPIQTGQK